MKTTWRTATMLLSILTAASGCMRERAEPSDIPQYYEVHPVSVVRSVEAGEVFRIDFSDVTRTAERCFVDDGIGFDICFEGEDFLLMISKKGGEAVTLRWPEARWVDQDGTAYPVCHCDEGQPDGIRAPILAPGVADTLSGGERATSFRREVVLPAYRDPKFAKEDPINDCMFLRQERRWAPPSSDRATAKALRQQMDAAVALGKPMKLVLPLEAGSEKSTYTFSFLLMPRADVIVTRTVH